MSIWDDYMDEWWAAYDSNPERSQNVFVTSSKDFFYGREGLPQTRSGGIGHLLVFEVGPSVEEIYGVKEIHFRDNDHLLWKKKTLAT